MMLCYRQLIITFTLIMISLSSSFAQIEEDRDSLTFTITENFLPPVPLINRLSEEDRHLYEEGSATEFVKMLGTWRLDRVDSAMAVPKRGHSGEESQTITVVSDSTIQRGRDNFVIIYNGVVQDNRTGTSEFFRLTRLGSRYSYIRYNEEIDSVISVMDWDSSAEKAVLDEVVASDNAPDIRGYNPAYFNHWKDNRPSSWEVTDKSVYTAHEYFRKTTFYIVRDSAKTLRAVAAPGYRVYRFWDEEGNTLKNSRAQGRVYWASEMSFLGMGKSSQLGWGGTAGLIFPISLPVEVKDNGRIKNPIFPQAMYSFLNGGEAGMSFETGVGFYNGRDVINGTLFGVGIQVLGGWKSGITDLERGDLHCGVGGVISFPAVAMVRGNILTEVVGEDRGDITYGLSVDVNLLWPVLGTGVLFGALFGMF